MATYRGSGGSTSTTDQATIDQVAEDAATATTKAAEAAASASSASSSASSATTSKNAAASSASSAASSATTATTKASEASTSASNAATSATNAASSATSASGSATNAASEAAAALASKGLAVDAQTAAEAAEANAILMNEDAQKSAYGAEDVLQTLSDSSTLYSARHYAAKAEESYTNTSSTIDAAVATATAAAASSATDSANSATASANSATSSANSATAAASSASAAQAAEDAALAALDSFDDRYLGVKTSDPTTDNDGNALVAGALYYNSTDDVMKVYEGSIWVAAYASLSGTLVAANNLSDVASASAARTNLGLGTAATTASTDYVAVTGDSMTGNLTFGDNDKAIFGAGSDLQIFHDSANSYIRDLGTGNLNIHGSNLNLADADGNNYISMADGGAGGTVNLHHLGNIKLATTSTGIDVTGTVVADGLSVEAASPTLILKDSDSTGTAASGSIKFNDSDDSTSAQIGFLSGSNSDFDIYQVENAAIDVWTNSTQRMSVEGNGDISFYEDTGTTPKFFWDASAESLGIGTTPENWHSSYNALQIGGVSALSGYSSGVVTADTKLTTNAYRNSGGTWSYVISDKALEYNQYNGAHIWKSAALGTADAAITWSESMRIDSSGNLLVGMTSDAANTVGVRARGEGLLTSTRDGSQSAIFGRKTSDGDIVLFQKDGTTVGSIGVSASDDIYFAGGTGSTKGIYFNANGVLPATTGGSASDGTVDIGESITRWKDIYLSGKLTNNGTGGIQVDTSGNVGIGTSSPFSALHLGGGESAPATSGNMADNGITVSNGTGGRAIQIGVDDASARSYIQAGYVNNCNVANHLSFLNGANESMRIDSSGNVGIGTSSPSYKLDVNKGSAGIAARFTASSDNGRGLAFTSADNGIYLGAHWTRDVASSGGIHSWSISSTEGMRLESDRDLHVDGDVIAYSTTISDERLKENIVGIDGALDKVSQLNGYTFNYKADGKISAGVIAQEVEKVLPEAVSEKELPLKADDDEQYKVVNYDALHGLMIEAIKELTNKVNELEAKLEKQ